MNDIVKTLSDLTIAISTVLLVVHSATILRATRELVTSSERMAQAEWLETELLDFAVDPQFKLAHRVLDDALELSAEVAVTVLAVEVHGGEGGKVSSLSTQLPGLLEPHGQPIIVETTRRATSLEVTWVAARYANERKAILTVTYGNRQSPLAPPSSPPST